MRTRWVGACVRVYVCASSPASRLEGVTNEAAYQEEMRRRLEQKALEKDLIREGKSPLEILLIKQKTDRKSTTSRKALNKPKHDDRASGAKQLPVMPQARPYVPPAVVLYGCALVRCLLWSRRCAFVAVLTRTLLDALWSQFPSCSHRSLLTRHTHTPQRSVTTPPPVPVNMGVDSKAHELIARQFTPIEGLSQRDNEFLRQFVVSMAVKVRVYEVVLERVCSALHCTAPLAGPRPLTAAGLLCPGNGGAKARPLRHHQDDVEDGSHRPQAHVGVQEETVECHDY